MNSMPPHKNEKGAAVIEFALVLPLLLLLVFGIIEFGIILFDKAVLTNASREGARAGIVSQSPRVDETEIRTIVEAYCANHLITFGASPVPVTVTAPPPSATPIFGDDLRVTASYSYDFLLVPDFIPGIPQTLTLEAVSVMKYE